MKLPVRLIEGAILACTALLVVATSESEPMSWTTTTTVQGTAVVLDEAVPDVITDVDLVLSATTIDVTDPVSGDLTLEATLTWNPPLTDPTAAAPEVVVGMAEGNFGPEGAGRAAGIPGSEPRVLTATRRVLGTCSITTGCTERLRMHFLAGALPAGASLDVSWTLTADVVGSGRSSPPPGVAVTITEVTATP
ncbi:MAG: hypothetical protein P1V51_25000 [Deltaproteobacteria bacterium]|nr:hypothetical protein [Deltaproteobacteria bacterium]